MPGGWTSCARRAVCAAAALLLVCASGDALLKEASAAETRLPLRTFFEMYVDHPRRQVLVSGGSGSNAVFVYGYDGRLVSRIDGLPGAADLLVEGNRMYVAMSNANRIAVVDLEKLQIEDTIDLSPYAAPLYLSKTGDTIFFSHSCDEIPGGFASIDLGTRLILNHSHSMSECPEHAFAPGDPLTMYQWEPGGVAPIVRYAVVGRSLVKRDQTGRGFYSDPTFSKDGETFFARNAPFYGDEGVDQLRIADLSLVLKYPYYAASYAVTPDERLILSAYGSEIQVYRSGRVSPVTTVDLEDSDYDWTRHVPGALATSASGDRLFTVVDDGNGGEYPLSFRVVWPQDRVATGPADQTVPAAGGGFEVWSSAEPRARHATLLARGDGKAFRVNPPGTSGFAGGIEGPRLVFQVVRGRRSDLRTYDLRKRRQVSDLPRLNTRGWEWHPSMSQGRILFGRFTKTRTQVVLATRRGQRILASLPRKSGLAVSGQVNGGYAVWNVCSRTCEVYRYAIASRRRLRVPRVRGRLNYAPSVTRSGAVYFAESGIGCGTNVELLRFARGRTTVVQDLPEWDDVMFTYADDDSGRVLFDRIHCNGKRWDVLSFRDAVSAGDARGEADTPEEEAPPGEPTGDVWFEDLLPGRP